MQLNRTGCVVAVLITLTSLGWTQEAPQPPLRIEPSTPRGSRPTAPREVVSPDTAPLQREASGPTVYRIGTRLTWFSILSKNGDLEENKFSEDMSINTLTAEQNYLPIKVYADWFFSEHYGLELTWDRIEAGADTRGWTEGEDDALTYEDYRDGIISLTGPLCTFIGEYPVALASLPCRLSWGIGLAYLFGDFKAESWWYDRGYKHHNMETDDTLGYLATADLRGYVGNQVSVDVYVRYLKADADDTLTITFNNADREPETRSATFPMDNIAMGLGASWDF